MERLELRYNDAKKALETLERILKESFSVIIRDATIQRFEYTFEATWKFLKEYLKIKEGILAQTPKSVFREVGCLGFLSENEVVNCLEMTDQRNLTSHTYREDVAGMIFENIPENTKLIKKILDQVNL